MHLKSTHAAQKSTITNLSLFSAIYSGWFVYFGAYATTVFAVSAGVLSLLFFAAGTMQLIANNVAPILMRRFDPVRLIVIAMLAVMQEAIARARRGEGGTVVEAVTYRLSDHTTADDARRYRPDDEVKQAWEREPLKRLRKYLEALGHWDEVPSLISLERITKIQFDTPYLRRFMRYVEPFPAH